MNDGKQKTETGNNLSGSVLFDDLFLRVRGGLKGYEGTVSEVRRHFLGVGRTERERRGDVRTVGLTDLRVSWRTQN